MAQHLEYQEVLKRNDRTYVKILLKETTVQNKARENGQSTGRDKRSANKRRKGNIHNATHKCGSTDRIGFSGEKRTGTTQPRL